MTEPEPAPLPARPLALLLALAAALLLFHAGSVPLVGPDEPRYARVAVEMARSGDLVTPTLQGRPWLEKPALYYWLAAASFRLLGETEAAARVPSLLAALIFASSTAVLGARLLGARAALHAGFVLATSLLFFAYGRAASMDMLLAAFVTVATGLLGLRLLGRAGNRDLLVAWAAVGLATLAKGPLGLLLPALVVLGQAALTRDLRSLRRVVSWPSLLVFAAVAGPWYAAILHAQGRHFVEVFLLDHNLQRFTSTIHRHPGPFYYYLPVLVVGLFPWSALPLAGLGGLAPRASRRDLFLLLWLVAPLLFFSAAGSKLPGYALPCLPPLALLAGRGAVRLVDGLTSSARAVALLTLVLAATTAALPAALRGRGDPGWAATVPLALWALGVAFAFSRRVEGDAASALAILRVGGAGLLALLATVAPGVLARHESGRGLFLAAHRRPVLAWGAWRTAWMAGYFYNDGKVAEAGFPEVLAAVEKGPALVLAGPGEHRRLERVPGFEVRALAAGPRGNDLLRVERR